MGTAIRATCNLLPNAKVLAMFAFDSYSQSKRSPRPLSRHRPCKTPFPIGNATFNKLPRFCLKWVFLINSQWNAGFIQPFLPRTAQSASSRSHCYSGTRKSHQLCSHFLFCMELRPPQARKSHSQKRRSSSRQKPSETSKNQQQLPQRQQEESSKSKNGAAEAPVHNLNAASGIDKY